MPQSFTTGPAAEHVVRKEWQGTWLGILDRLDALVSAGINTVILSPVVLAAPSGAGERQSPLSFFAPSCQVRAGPALSAGGVGGVVGSGENGCSGSEGGGGSAAEGGSGDGGDGNGGQLV